MPKGISGKSWKKFKLTDEDIKSYEDWRKEGHIPGNPNDTIEKLKIYKKQAKSIINILLDYMEKNPQQHVPTREYNTLTLAKLVQEKQNFGSDLKNSNKGELHKIPPFLNSIIQSLKQKHANYFSKEMSPNNHRKGQIMHLYSITIHRVIKEMLLHLDHKAPSATYWLQNATEIQNLTKRIWCEKVNLKLVYGNMNPHAKPFHPSHRPFNPDAKDFVPGADEHHMSPMPLHPNAKKSVPRRPRRFHPKKSVPP
jgi:hypothetical protein